MTIIIFFSDGETKTHTKVERCDIHETFVVITKGKQVLYYKRRQISTIVYLP